MEALFRLCFGENESWDHDTRSSFCCSVVDPGSQTCRCGCTFDIRHDDFSGRSLRTTCLNELLTLGGKVYLDRPFGDVRFQHPLLAVEHVPDCIPSLVATYDRRGDFDISDAGLRLFGQEAKSRADRFSLRRTVVEGVHCQRGPRFGLRLDEIGEWWRYLLERELRICGEDSPAIVTVAPVAPEREFVGISEGLFESCGVPLAAFPNSASVALFAAGRESGLVIDAGHDVTMITSLVEGSVENSRRLLLAGRHAQIGLEDYVSASLACSPFHATEFAEDIKHKHGFVASAPKRILSENCDYLLPDGSALGIPFSILARSSEILFSGIPSLQIPSLPEEIIHAMTQAKSNKFRLLIGGTSRLMGFQSRLENEVGAEMSTTEFRYPSWIGASILPLVPSCSNMWLSRADYEELGVEHFLMKKKEEAHSNDVSGVRSRVGEWVRSHFPNFEVDDACEPERVSYLSLLLSDPGYSSGVREIRFAGKVDLIILRMWFVLFLARED